MTLQQAIDIIKEYTPDRELVLTIQFNTDDEWFDASVTPRGDPSDDLASISCDGHLETAIISLAEELDSKGEK